MAEKAAGRIIACMAYLRTFSTLGAPELSLEETLALATAHRIPAVELRALGGTIELPAYLAATYGSPETLASKLRDHPVRVVGLGTSLHLIGNTRENREHFLDYVPWAEALEVPRLRVFDGGINADAAEIAQGVETLKWWRALRDEQGWQTDLMIETHNALVTTPALQRLLAAAPTGTGILWDAHHTWKKGGENPVETWTALQPHICHIHVKDSVNRPSTRTPYSFVLPGEGEFPMQPLVEQLCSAGYAGPLSLEWEKLWHPQLPPLEQALQAAHQRHWW